MLYQARLGTPSKKVPSWVPNFAKPLLESVLVYRGSFRASSNYTARVSPGIPLYNNLNVFTMAGIFIDTIKSQLSDFQALGIGYKGDEYSIAAQAEKWCWLHVNAHLHSPKEHPYITGESIRLALPQDIGL